MIAIPALLAILFGCTLLEHYVKNAKIRIIGVLIIVIIVAGIAINIGMKLGKSEQLNKFARVFPRALKVLDYSNQRPEIFEDTIKLLLDATSDPAKLDQLESTIDEIERAGEK
jgi:Flp pilus assembly protein TadB